MATYRHDFIPESAYRSGHDAESRRLYEHEHDNASAQKQDAGE